MIVTGGSRGIGAAIARLAGRRGYDVCVNYTKSKDQAEQVVRDIEASGQRAVAVLGDIGNETELTSLYEFVDRELSPLTALVNNAAIDYETAIADFETDGLRRVYAVNVFAPFIAAREAGLMKAVVSVELPGFARGSCLRRDTGVIEIATSVNKWLRGC
jgi:NAD(P)-dependent dehydrogenase (short-subunit alcohol dehydrogenase family)